MAEIQLLSVTDSLSLTLCHCHCHSLSLSLTGCDTPSACGPSRRASTAVSVLRAPLPYLWYPWWCTEAVDAAGECPDTLTGQHRDGRTRDAWHIPLQDSSTPHHHHHHLCVELASGRVTAQGTMTRAGEVVVPTKGGRRHTAQDIAWADVSAAPAAGMWVCDAANVHITLLSKRQHPPPGLPSSPSACVAVQTCHPGCE